MTVILRHDTLVRAAQLATRCSAPPVKYSRISCSRCCTSRRIGSANRENLETNELYEPPEESPSDWRRIAERVAFGRQSVLPELQLHDTAFPESLADASSRPEDIRFVMPNRVEDGLQRRVHALHLKVLVED